MYLEKSIIVSIVDVDINLNPEALDNLPIQIFSDSDVAGIEVNAVETSESSGFFIATVSLSQNSPSSGNSLYSLSGDKIFAKYDDHTLSEPYSKSDNLPIETVAIVNLSIPPIERIKNLSITFSDGSGNSLQFFSTNSQMQIVGTILNEHDFNQKFIYVFQVKNNKNVIESLSWIQSEISSTQSLDIPQSWTPTKSGIYKIETFVWNSINDSTALSPFVSTMITIP